MKRTAPIRLAVSAASASPSVVSAVEVNSATRVITSHIGRGRPIAIGKKLDAPSSRKPTSKGSRPRGPSDQRPIRLASQGSQAQPDGSLDRKSTRLNSSHVKISYAVFCLNTKREHIP